MIGRLALAFVAFVWLGVGASDTRAEPARVEVETGLLKMLAGEAGLKPRRDHDAILHAIHLLDKRESRSSNVLETMAIHIPWWKRGAPPRRAWIANLDTSCVYPEGFRYRWEGSNQGLCFRLVGRIRGYFAGTVANPCKGTPDQWRARGRWSKRAKRLYFQVGCGRDALHNFFDTRRKK